MIQLWVGWFPALARFCEFTQARCLLAGLTGGILSLLIGGWMIRLFKRRQVLENVAPRQHAGLDAAQAEKKNVPTLGGLMILAAALAATLIWGEIWWGALRMVSLPICLALMLALAGLGLVDDSRKLARVPGGGVKKRWKLLIEFLLGLGAGWLIWNAGGHALTSESGLAWLIGRDPGAWFILWAAFVIAATTNAVNLTDGLDGLAGGCTAIAGTALIALAFCQMAWLPSGRETCILMAATVGAVIGFLWYNGNPAHIFMGDTGSLALGGVLAMVALWTGLDLILFPVGLVFFGNELSVALQVGCFKLTGKRIFPITPLHHYYQVYLKWPEQKIVLRFWIVALAAALACILFAVGFNA